MSQHAIGLRVEPDQFRLAPGTSVVLLASVENRGHLVDRLSLTVHGVDADWAAVPVSSVELFPDDQTTLEVRLSVPSVPLARAGAHPIQLRLASSVDPAVSTEAVVTLDVLQVGGVYVRLAPRVVNARAAGKARLLLANDSNADQAIGLRFEDPEDALDGALGQSYVALPPGERREVDLSISPRRRALFAPPRRYPFSIAATREAAIAQEPIADVSGELVYASPLAWLANLFGGVLRVGRSLMVPAVMAAVALYVLGSPGGRDMAAGAANRAAQAGLPVPAQLTALAPVAQPAPAVVTDPLAANADSSAVAGGAAGSAASPQAGSPQTANGQAAAKPSQATAKPGSPADQTIAGASSAPLAPSASEAPPPDNESATHEPDADAGETRVSPEAADRATPVSPTDDADHVLNRLPTTDEAAPTLANPAPYVQPASASALAPVEAPTSLPPIAALPLPSRPAVEPTVVPVPVVVVEEGKIDDGAPSGGGDGEAPGSPRRPKYMWCYWGEEAQMHRLDLCTPPVLICPPSADGQQLCDVPPPVPCTDPQADFPCQQLWIVCPDGESLTACVPKQVAWPPDWTELVRDVENPDPLILAEIEQLKRQSLQLVELEEMARLTNAIPLDQLREQRRRLMETFALADSVRLQAELDQLSTFQVGRVVELQLRGATGLLTTQSRELAEVARPAAAVTTVQTSPSRLTAQPAAVVEAPAQTTTTQLAPSQTTIQQAPAQTTTTQLAPSQTTIQQAPAQTTTTQLAPSQTTIQQAPAQTTTTQLAPSQTTIQQAPAQTTTTQLAPSQTTVQQAPAQTTTTQLAPAQTTVQQAPAQTTVQQAPAQTTTTQQAPSQTTVQQAPSTLERTAAVAPVQQAPTTIDKSAQLRSAPSTISPPANDATVSRPVTQIQQAPINRVAGP